MSEFFQTQLDRLAGILKPVFAPLNDFLASLDPSTGRWCAVGLFGLALVWSLMLRRDFVFRGAPDQAAWRDLRVWTVIAIAPYIFIYLFLF